MSRRSVVPAALLATVVVASGFLEPGATRAATSTSARLAPLPRATFHVTVERRTSGHIKISSWTNVPLHGDGTLVTRAPRRPRATVTARHP